MEKTNVCRILDQKKIKYEMFEYPHIDGVCVDGIEVAKLLNQDFNQVFKTLVCISNTKHYFVCVVGVSHELDLKKCAKAFNQKSLEMIPLKDLLNTTGYIRGGCSPIGMKKAFETVVDIDALNYSEIIFSAGKIGYQVKMNPKDLEKLIKVKFLDIKKVDLC